MHHEVPAFSGTDQTAGRGLPFLKILFSLRQLHDVGGGIVEGDELATAGQGDWVLEWTGPRHHLRGSLSRFIVNSIFRD
jgi:hypothetical protein